MKDDEENVGGGGRQSVGSMAKHWEELVRKKEDTEA